jgi:hypothetical protein
MGALWHFFSDESDDPCAVTPQQERLIHHHQLHGCDSPEYEITLFGNLRCRNCGQKF